MVDKIKWSYIDVWAKKIKAISFLGGKCEICGEDRPYLLMFHHLKSEEKENNIQNIKSLRWSIIEKEVKKCKLLCHNCHRCLHDEMAQKTKLKSKRLRNKKLILDFVDQFECEVCSFKKSVCALDFHHVNVKNKKHKISREVDIKKWKTIKDVEYDLLNEISDCKVLCANCHILEHFDLEKFKEYENEIILKSKNIKEIQKKIDREKVLSMLLGGKKQIEIAKHFNAGKGTISDIVKYLKKNNFIP